MRLDSTLLVTIRGPFNMLDLVLPGDVIIGELLPLLLEMCRKESINPQALRQTEARLQVAGTDAPLPLHQTLIDAGVCNGTVLDLHIQGSRTMPTSIQEPQGLGRRVVQPGVHTGGIGVTWQSLT
jgi:hypothetical protein